MTSVNCDFRNILPWKFLEFKTNFLKVEREWDLIFHDSGGTNEWRHMKIALHKKKKINARRKDKQDAQQAQNHGGRRTTLWCSTVSSHRHESVKYIEKAERQKDKGTRKRSRSVLTLNQGAADEAEETAQGSAQLLLTPVFTPDHHLHAEVHVQTQDQKTQSRLLLKKNKKLTGLLLNCTFWSVRSRSPDSRREP